MSCYDAKVRYKVLNVKECYVTLTYSNNNIMSWFEISTTPVVCCTRFAICAQRAMDEAL